MRRQRRATQASNGASRVTSVLPATRISSPNNRCTVAPDSRSVADICTRHVLRTWRSSRLAGKHRLRRRCGGPGDDAVRVSDFVPVSGCAPRGLHHRGFHRLFAEARKFFDHVSTLAGHYGSRRFSRSTNARSAPVSRSRITRRPLAARSSRSDLRRRKSRGGSVPRRSHGPADSRDHLSHVHVKEGASTTSGRQAAGYGPTGGPLDGCMRCRHPPGSPLHRSRLPRVGVVEDFSDSRPVPCYCASTRSSCGNMPTSKLQSPSHSDPTHHIPDRTIMNDTHPGFSCDRRRRGPRLGDQPPNASAQGGDTVILLDNADAVRAVALKLALSDETGAQVLGWL